MAVDRRWVLGGLLAAAGIGAAAVITARPKIRPDTRLLLIGDSLARGLDTHFRQLAREEGVSYVGRGISGSRIDQWARDPWVDQTLRSYKPTLILVSLGTNDEYMGPGAARQQRPYMHELLAKLDESGAEIVWIAPPRLPIANRGVAQMIRQQAPYVFPSRDYVIPRGPDRLHPTAAGYAGWAGAIWKWLS